MTCIYLIQIHKIYSHQFKIYLNFQSLMQSTHVSNPQTLKQTSRVLASNTLSKEGQPRIQESYTFKSKILGPQEKSYDPEYRSGYPKLYAYDSTTQNKAKGSLDVKGKYSFRNDYSKIVEQNTIFYQENAFLKQEVTRLNNLIENERRNESSRIEFERLNSILIQKDTEVRTLNERVYSLQNQANLSNQWQNRFNESQIIIAQLNGRINSQNIQYESQINQLNLRISQYQSEITQLNIKASQVSQPVQIKADPQVNILKTQISGLTSKIQQYQVQISQYERNFAQFQSQIYSLQQANWRLQENHKRTIVMTDNEKWISQQARYNFRTIVLLEEINRLKQRENELILKAEELHAYLLKAENYIEQIQLELEKNSSKENIPAYVVERAKYLEQQNTRYATLIKELQSRLTNQYGGVKSQAHITELAKRDFRIIILLEENNRLNHKVLEVGQYLERAQKYIGELQAINQQRSNSKSKSQFEAQINFLSEQNHRLNILVENYINQLKNYKSKLSVSPQVESRLAFLAQENQRLKLYANELQTKPIKANQVLEAAFSKSKFQNIILLQEINRLNYSVKQQHSHLVNAETFIEQCEIKISQLNRTILTRSQQVPPEIQSKLAFLAQENERLSREVQLKANRVQYRISPQIEGKIALLASQNQRLERQIVLGSNNKQNILQTAKESRLQLQIIFLFSEINRLNYVREQLTKNLLTAENYIFQIESRPPTVPAALQAELLNLRRQNQTLLQQVAIDKTEISKINIQLSTFRSEAMTFKSKFQDLQRKAKLASSESYVDTQLQKSLAVSTLKNIFLLQEINRLNKKVQTVDSQKTEVVGHLVQAENFIQKLETKCSKLQIDLKQSRATEISSRVKSGSSVQVQTRGKLEVASRDLRIIFLLQEINRLNQKVESLGGFENGEMYNQFYVLQQEKEEVQRELSEIIEHLRQAEEYIAQLLKENEGLSQERDELFYEMNTIKQRL